MDEHTPPPDVRRRGLLYRAAALLLHWLERKIRGERRSCPGHCHCVTELQTAANGARWVAGLALSAAFAALASRGCDLASVRLPWTAPPARAGDRLGADHVTR